MKQRVLAGATAGDHVSAGHDRSSDVSIGHDASATVDALAGEIGSLRLLVDQFPAVFWTTDSELRFTSSLGAGLTALGLGPNQLVGMTLHDFFEAGQPQPLEAHRRALTGRSVTYLMRWGGRTFHSHVAPLRDGQGRIIGTICIAVEVEEAGSQEAAGRPTALDDSGHREEWHFIAPG
jgi:PAS domain-containing protein